MAIGTNYFKLVANLVRYIRQNCNTGKSLKTACLSYLDVLIDDAGLRKMMGDNFVDSLTAIPDIAKLAAYHGLDPNLTYYKTESVFESLGLDCTFFDVKAHRGIEQFLDLNYDLPHEYYRKFEFLIDCGTLEHCFNVGNAFKSMCDMIALDGVVITSAPLNSINHGFWNFSPTVYLDTFRQNGFKVLGIFVMTPGGMGRVEEVIDIGHNPFSREFKFPPECGIACVARRITDQEFTMPIQSKYKASLS